MKSDDEDNSDLEFEILDQDDFQRPPIPVIDLTNEPSQKEEEEPDFVFDPNWVPQPIELLPEEIPTSVYEEEEIQIRSSIPEDERTEVLRQWEQIGEELGSEEAERFIDLFRKQSEAEDEESGVREWTSHPVDSDSEEFEDEELAAIAEDFRRMEELRYEAEGRRPPKAVKRYKLDLGKTKGQRRLGEHQFDYEPGAKADVCEEAEMQAADRFVPLSDEGDRLVRRARLHGMLTGTNPLRDMITDEIQLMTQISNRLSDIGVKLGPYQWKGINWMYSVFLQSIFANGNVDLSASVDEKPSGPYGVCLADSVGLGKTIQSSSVIRLIYERMVTTRRSMGGDESWKYKGKILIIVPSQAHQEQWRKELTRIFGNDIFRMRIHALDVDTVPRDLPLAIKDIIIGTPAIFQTRNDTYERMRAELRRVRWACVLVDEAHSLRNGAYIYQELKRLTSDFRIALTATPYANRPSNILCLFNFVTPGAIGRDGEGDVEKMRQKVADHFLFGRRIATPYRTHCFDIYIDLPPDEREKYMDVYNTAYSDPMSKAHALKAVLTYPDYVIPPKNEEGIALNPSEVVMYRRAEEDRQGIEVVKTPKGKHDYKVIYRFREGMFNIGALYAALHTNALPDYTPDNIMRVGSSFVSLRHYLDRTEPMFGTKMLICMKIIRAILERGEKALIFVKKISLIEALQIEIARFFPEIEVGVIYGEVNQETRIGLLKEFNEVPIVDKDGVSHPRVTRMKVMILTYDTGGQGLDIPIATHVILFDLDYIYLQTEQAIGRVQRLNTQKSLDLYTYRILMRKTLDVNFAQLQNSKRYMNDLLLGSVTEEQVMQEILEDEGEMPFDEHHQLYVPGNFWKYSSKDNSCIWQRVMTMQDLDTMLNEQVHRKTMDRPREDSRPDDDVVADKRPAAETPSLINDEGPPRQRVRVEEDEEKKEEDEVAARLRARELLEEDIAALHNF